MDACHIGSNVHLATPQTRVLLDLGGANATQTDEFSADLEAGWQHAYPLRINEQLATSPGGFVNPVLRYSRP